MSDFVKVIKPEEWDAIDKWIPIENGMPCKINGDSENVLVTFVEPDFVLEDPEDGPDIALDVTKGYYEEGKWYEFQTTTIAKRRELVVVAWMPLPKRYIPSLKTTLRAVSLMLKSDEEEEETT